VVNKNCYYRWHERNWKYHGITDGGFLVWYGVAGTYGRKFISKIPHFFKRTAN
jgi:hypothetical protein